MSIIDPDRSPPSALITGASRGIGLGIARLLATQGWALTITARDTDRLTTVKTELEELGGTVDAIAADLTDETALDAVVDYHTQTHGRLNALILAAGIGSAGPIDGYPLRRFDKQIAVNLRAPFALLARTLPLLRAGAAAEPERGARIVALSSVEGVYPETGLSAYAAAKAGLISLVRSINLEENPHGIVATAISPGYVNTDMSAWTTDTIPTQDMLPVSDIVKIVDLILNLSPNAVLPHILINRAKGSAYHA